MYAELHAKTNFSFLEGASHPDELVRRAAELGYCALAVTDRNSLAGVVRAHGAAKDVGLKLIIGVEITPDDAPPVVLWAGDRASYGRLSRLITLGRRRAHKGECRLRFDDIAPHQLASPRRVYHGDTEATEVYRTKGGNQYSRWLLPKQKYGVCCRNQFSQVLLFSVPSASPW
jgi:DNA polymerase III alpha subunit